MRKTAAMAFGGAGSGSPGFGAFGAPAAADDDAATKSRALSQMPPFLGSGSGSGKGPITADDAEERAARARRNARFGDTAAPSQPPSNSVFAAAAATPLPFQSNANDEDDFGALQQQQLARGAPIVGTCEFMCPDSEIERRHRIEDVAVFERVEPSLARTSRELAVKKFARNIEQRADNFRTRAALERTQAHLRAIMDSGAAASSSPAAAPAAFPSSRSSSSAPPLSLVHRFLWDRYRGVRQDLFVQGIEDAWAAALYEEHVRFMVLAEHELCELRPQAGEAETFDSHLNLEQINKSLISLGTMYDRLAAAGTPLRSEAEFRGYHLLTLAGTHGRYRFSASTLRDALASLRAPVLASEPVGRALRFARALSSGDWAGFFAELRAAPYLDACLAHMFVRGVRARALTTLAAAEGGQALPVADLARGLGLEAGEGGRRSGEEACAELLKAAGLEVDDGGAAAGASSVPAASPLASSEGPTVTLPRGATFEADDVPKWRSPGVSRKGNPRRSVDATGGGVLTSSLPPAAAPASASPAAPAPAPFFGGGFGGGGAAAASPAAPAAPAAAPLPPSYPPASFAFGVPQQQQQQQQAPDNAAAFAAGEAERARQEQQAAAAASAAAAAEKEAAERRAAEEAAAAASAAEAERAWQEQAAAAAKAAAEAAARAEEEHRRALEEQQQQRRRLEEEGRLRSAAEAAAARAAADEEVRRRRTLEEEEVRRRREEEEGAARQRELARVAAEAAVAAAAAAAQSAHDAAVRNLMERAALRRARRAALRWRSFATASRERRAAAGRREAALRGTRVGPRLAAAAPGVSAPASTPPLVAAQRAQQRQQPPRRGPRPASPWLSPPPPPLPAHARAAGFARLVAPGILAARRRRLRALSARSSRLAEAAEAATAGDDLWFKLLVSAPPPSSSSAAAASSSPPSPAAAAAAAAWLRRALPSAGRRAGGVLFSFAVESGAAGAAAAGNRVLRACAREVSESGVGKNAEAAEGASSALVLLLAADETPPAVAPRLRALVAPSASASAPRRRLPLLIVVAASCPPGGLASGVAGGGAEGKGARPPPPPPPPAEDVAAWASAELRAAFPASDSPVSALRAITVDASAPPSSAPCEPLERGLEWLAATAEAGGVEGGPAVAAVPLAALARRAARAALSSAALSSSTPSEGVVSPLSLIGSFSSALDWVRGEAERAAAAAGAGAAGDGASWPPADAGAVFVVPSAAAAALPSSPPPSPPAVCGPFPGWASTQALETVSRALEAAAPPRTFPVAALATGDERDVAAAVSAYCRQICCSASSSFSDPPALGEWREELEEAMFSRLGSALDASGIAVVVGVEALLKAGSGDGSGGGEESEVGRIAAAAAAAVAEAPPSLALAPPPSSSPSANGGALVVLQQQQQQPQQMKRQRWTLWRGAPRQSTAAPYCSAAVAAVTGLKRPRVSSGGGGIAAAAAAAPALSPSSRRQRTSREAPPPAVAAAAMGALSRALSEARAAGGAFSAWLERAAGGGGIRGGSDRIDGNAPDDPLGLSSIAIYSYANKASNGGSSAAAAPLLASLGEFEAERDASAALTAAMQRAAGGGL